MKHHTSRITRRQFGGLAAGIAAAAALSGCGDSSAESGGGGGKLKVLQAPVFFESLVIADREGYFKDQGLEVERVLGGTAAQQVAQLAAGEIDIAATGGVSTIAAVAQGMPLKAVMGQSNATPRPITSGILVKKDSGISDYTDLAGKRVGLQGLKETTHLGTLLALEDSGVDPDSVEFVKLPLPSLNDAVMKGQVDAAYNIASFYPTGLEMGLERIGSPASEFLVGGPNAWYVTTDDFIASDADRLTKFIAAMEKATDHAVKNPDLVKELQVEFTEQDPEYIENAPIQKLTTAIDEEGATTTINGMIDYDFVASEVGYDDVVWSDARQS